MEEQARKEIRDEFRRVVNMAPQELEEWLATEESESVGYVREGEDEAVGHKSGRRIVAIKRSRQAELSDDDYAHMRKVIGYVHRHCAQRPRRRRERHALALLADELGPRHSEALSLAGCLWSPLDRSGRAG